MDKLTPAMRQYMRIKQKCGDALLFFRMGDFYEMFFDDAKLASKLLGITLTTRDRDKPAEQRIPMAGVPHHSVDSYVRRLIRAGYKVAVCEQLQDACEAKDLIERDITRIITAGTLTEDSLLEAKEPNYLAALYPEGSLVGLAYAELSTGGFFVEEVRTAELADELLRISPSEVLVPEGVGDTLPRLLREILDRAPSFRSPLVFERENAVRLLHEHFGVSSLDGFGFEDTTSPGLSAAGAVIDYLKETQRVSLPHIRRIQRFARTDFVVLGSGAVRSLELLETSRTRQREGSLLWVLDQTQTPMGARLLREWILAPLKDIPTINRRLSAVEELVENGALRKSLQETLRGIQDLERLGSRLACLRINPRELILLRNSAAALPALKEHLDAASSPLLGELGQTIDPLDDIRELVQKAIQDEPPIALREGGIIREGFNAELDELRAVQRDGKQWLAAYQAKLAQSTRIDSLKIGYNQVFGYYIEVTNPHLSKVPAGFIPAQTLKNAQRYKTPELSEYEAKLMRAAGHSKDLEYKLFLEIRDKVRDALGRLQATAGRVAAVDVLVALAEVAARHRYVRPEVNDSFQIEIVAGRHPALEQILPEPFVPNDVYLNSTDSRILIITGPNMAGKSTYIRQVALITLMAQIGSYVPAESAKIGIVDKVFTRIGAADELARGQSTFMVEMIETANILNNATSRSLIVLDEVGRGTSTFDGLSIAWAVSEYLAQKVGARTLFATHYHQLTELSSTLDCVKNYNVAVKEWQGKLIFLHKIVEGRSDKSYGIQVASLAGVPREVIDRARDVLDALEAQATDSRGRSRLTPNAKRGERFVQLTLFDSAWDALIEKIRTADIDNLTPLQALQLLKELRDEVDRQ